MFQERIRCKKLLDKVTPAEQAAALIKDGMNIGTSGFTPAGYPKAVPLALAQRVQETGEKIKINLFTGASVGEELDDALVKMGVINKRLPYQTSDLLRFDLNTPGGVEYQDLHLSHMAQQLRYGFFGDLDLAIVEACAITEEGNIVPTTSLGNSPTFVKAAKQVIVEINTGQPLALEGMHDVYIPDDPPYRSPIPLTCPEQRIGTPYIECDPHKIAAVVVTNIPDKVRPLGTIDDVSKAMAQNLITFLKNEVKAKRLPETLLPMQSGVGSIANAVLAGLVESDFRDLMFYSEVIQDAALDCIDAGIFKICSGSSLTLSVNGMQRFYDNIEKYKKHIILRPQEISNNPEIIRRLGVISMNTAIEADIYGHVNSTHIMGTRMMNGIGGAGDFTRNAYFSIFLTASTAKDGNISSIVPMCSHIDHTEHDVSVIITERGTADLRNKSPRERALEIINNCAHPDYIPLLMDYYKRALNSLEKGKCHTPHMMGEAHSFHKRFMETGTMRKKYVAKISEARFYT